MLKKFLPILAVPACLIAIAPFVVGSVTAESDFHDNGGFPKFTPLSFENSARLFGWPNAAANVTLRTAKPVETDPVAGLTPDPTIKPADGLLAAFRGLAEQEPENWRFDQVLSRHEIELKSGPDELVNIQLAANAIDNSVIMPGSTFSFNEQVGVRSEDKGYREGLMFQQGQVVRGVGGGICLVATGLFDAALKAGLKIIDRNPHSAVPRYSAPGFDAAVAYGLLDLKVKNDTSTPVLIRCTIDNDIFAITLLGRKTPGVQVTLATENAKELPYKIFEKPDPSVPAGELKVKQPAKPGIEITTVRIFTKDGKVIKREVVDFSRYLPHNKVILIPIPSEKDQAALASQEEQAMSAIELLPKPAPPKPAEEQPAVKKWEVTPAAPEKSTAPKDDLTANSEKESVQKKTTTTDEKDAGAGEHHVILP